MMKVYTPVTTSCGFTVVRTINGALGLIPSRWLKPGDGGNVCANSRKNAIRIECEGWRWISWPAADMRKAEVPEAWYVEHDGKCWAVSQTKHLRIVGRCSQKSIDSIDFDRCR